MVCGSIAQSDSFCTIHMWSSTTNHTRLNKISAHGHRNTCLKFPLLSICKASSNSKHRDGSKAAADGPIKNLNGLAASAALVAALSFSALSPPLSQAVTSEQLLFLEAWRAVDRAYVDKGFNGQSWFRVRESYLKAETMTTRDETYTAIKKLLASLDDRFTRFLEPERLTALRRGTSGQVTGVGVEVIESDSGLISVVTPLPGGPAESGGVRAGDLISAIDGRSTKGLSIYEATDLLLGEEGSEVTLSLAHSNQPAAVKEIKLARKKIVINPVMSALCSKVSPSVGLSSDSLGYIRIATFNGNTSRAFAEALLSLKKQGAGSLILDIRNNGGGLFPSGVQVARDLIDSGDIVLIADANGVRDIYSSDVGQVLDSTTPLSVLVNKGTASASEVLAGALKDSKRAVIVGQQTFGKGLIQSIIDLSDGSGVAVTVARYQTPLGTDINKKGITPDLELAADSIPIPNAASNKVCEALEGSNAPRLFR